MMVAARDRSPQRTLVFVQVAQDGGEKVGVVKVGDVSCVAAAGRPDESRPGGDDEHRNGPHRPQLPSSAGCGHGSPLRGDHQLADDMKSVISFDASANDSDVAIFVQTMKLELSRQKKTTGVSGGTALRLSFKSGMSLSTLSLVTFHPPSACL
jgi:hypothetical protein